MRLRRADEQTLGGAIERFEQFFAAEGRQHFEIEERLILPALAADDPEWAPGVRRVLDDHAAIRGAKPATVDAAHALGQRLNDHVRFEERVLFEILERRLPAAELDRLGQAIAAAERAAPIDPPAGL